jgi:hypothetical protein
VSTVAAAATADVAACPIITEIEAGQPGEPKAVGM